MAVDVQTQMKRLESAREKVRELDGRRNRLTALVEEREKRVAEIEAQARDEFECEIDELPTMIEQLQRESEEAIVQAESILGLTKEKPEEEDLDGFLN